MKKLIISMMAILFSFVMTHSSLAATITGTAPYLNISGYNLTLLNNEIKNQFEAAISQANADLAKYKDQEKLAIGFANANVYSTSVATQQGYPNYNRCHGSSTGAYNKC